MKRTPIASDVNAVVLAKGTPGFSGADLENLVNEAALLAAKRNKERLDMMDFEDAKDKVYMGLERKSRVIREEDRLTTAYHEGGHALVARFIPGTDAVNKITIIPRGRAAGITWFLPEERDFRYKDQLEAELAIAFGGRVAEEIVFDRISTGASNDIKKATELAQQMVRSWGMSELGPLSFAKDEEQVFLGREIAQHRDYSEETARKIDSQINKLVMESYERAKSVLTEYLDVLHKLADQLLEKETVLGAELDELIRQVRPGIELPEKPQDSVEDESEEQTDDTPSAPDGDASTQSDNDADKAETSADGAENSEDTPSKN
jgi:cell division protease FtsH